MELTPLAQCLEWEQSELGVPIPCKFLNKLVRGYFLEIPVFLDLLRQADPEERRAFYPQIYEVLYEMAQRNDARSIRTLFTLCPDLRPDGYFAIEQTLVLGAAIEFGAQDAIQALREAGCTWEMATWGVDTALGHALQHGSSREMLLWMLDREAPLYFSDLVTAWDKDPELAKEMLRHVRVLERGNSPKELMELSDTYEAAPELIAYLQSL